MLYTLAVVDVQARAFANLSASKQKLLLDGVTREVEQAKKDGVGVIVCEYDPDRYEGTCSFVTDLLKDYDRKLEFQHLERGICEEVMAIARQRGYDRSSLKLCGIGDLSADKECCLRLVNYQIQVEVIDDATIVWNGFR